MFATSDYSSLKVDEKEYNEGESISEIGLHSVVIIDEYGNSSEYSFTIKEPATQRQSSNPMSGLAEGSEIGTYILLALIIVLLIVLVIIPFIRSKRKNSFKRKLK